MDHYDRPPSEIVLPTLRGGAPLVEATATTYYGRPMIKAPHWRWWVPVYFFVGGVAGGAAPVRPLGRLVGRGRPRAPRRPPPHPTPLLPPSLPLFLLPHPR